MIISKDNEKIKHLNKLKLKKNRDKEEQFLIFGEHLITEAKNNSIEIVEIFTSNPNKGGTLISKELMKQINFTESPYDIIAICKKNHKTELSSKILLLEDVQDPDNVGALIRSASAFGFDTVVLSNKCADIYNDKTIRASKGSIFQINIIRTDIYEFVKKMKEQNYKVYITELTSEANPKLEENIILVLGNEGQGISQVMRELSDYSLTIKTKNVESLNVNVAGSILMYEWSK